MTSKKRTVFIGDIHGCYDELMDLLGKIHYHPGEDRLISLGDLVHKGPKSHKVIDFFYDSGHEVIMGNHDRHFLQAAKGEVRMYKEAEDILKKSKLSRNKIVKWMESFPYHIKGEGFIAVHGAFDPGKDKYSDTSHDDMVSGRFYELDKKIVLSTKKQGRKVNPWYEVYPEKKTPRTVVFGHWANPEVRTYKNFRCIDTGCCYGGRLSCYILQDDEIVSVNSRQKQQFNYGNKTESKIRPATAKDAEAICRIYNHYVTETVITFDEEPRSVEKFTKMIKSGNPWLVYIENGEVKGFAYTAPWKSKSAYRYTHESTIYLENNLTGKGAGSRLYNELISQSRDKGLKSLVACIVLPLDQSVKFHEKIGFKKTAHFKKVGFKKDKWLDVGYWQYKL